MGWWRWVRIVLGLATDSGLVPGKAGEVLKKGREKGLWTEKASPADIIRKELR